MNFLYDKYDGVIIDSLSIPSDENEFEERLLYLLQHLENKKLLWIKINISLSDHIPTLVRHKFVFHNCNENDITLVRKLIKNPIIPTATNHTLGVGAVVIKNSQLLVIKDKIWQKYKLPGGHIDDRENISSAIKREVFEETGIEVEFDSIVIENVLIGYLELGEEIGYMIPKLSESIDAQIIISIKKELMDNENFNKWLEIFDKDRKLINMKKFVIINSTIEDISDDLKKHVDNNEFLNEIQNITLDNKIYALTSINLEDASLKDVGIITVLVDINKEKKVLHTLLTRLTILSTFISILILIIFYRYLNKMQKTIDTNLEEIFQLSITDGLTKLYNRRYFDETAPKVIKLAVRNKQFLSFALLDIDNFKLYNDTYGHHKGDIVIKSVATSMKKIYKRDIDYLFRIGGEEFAIITLDKNPNDGISMANTLLKEIESLNIPHEKNNDFGKVTVSIGITTLKLNEEKNLEFLYKVADEQLYKSKTSGRNRVSMSDKYISKEDNP